MPPRAVNFLNMALMVASAAVAWVWPFPLFLFAYGVIGPLHYLTEISWLHDRRWFGSSARDWVVPAAAAVGVAAVSIVSMRNPSFGPIVLDVGGLTLRASWAQVITLAAIGTTFGAAFAGDGAGKAALAAGMVVIGAVLLQTASGRIFVGVFLATLVHVFVFTSCFILYGAFRTKSASGYVSWVVHLALPAAMLAIGWQSPAGIAVATADLQRAQPFHALLAATCTLFGVAPDRDHAVVAMRVVAYAYTYHYLNWFSKTGIIRWHEVPRRRLAVLGLVWAASVVVYFIDWNVSFVYLLALSLAHVFLEFPLNWRTVAGIGGEIRMRALAFRERAPG